MPRTSITNPRGSAPKRSHLFLLTITLLALTSLIQPASAQSIPEILAKIYDSTSGHNWETNNGWSKSSSSTHYCEWTGITCYDVDRYNELHHQIETIDLSDNKLEGDLPSDIWKIPFLSNLILRANPDLNVGFRGMRHATNLNKLALSNTNIGSFEHMHGGELRELHLTGCSLNMPFPIEITELKKLEALYANYNYFNGYLPDAIGDMESLVELYLFDNELEGPVPETLANLKNLEVLALSNNDLSGNVPSNLLNGLEHLRVLSIAGNQFTGHIPSLDGLEKVREVYLRDNDFTGSIPEDFMWSAPKDEEVIVDLSNNSLSGVFRARRIKDFYNMRLSITGNMFTGIDDELCSKHNWMGGLVEDYNCDAIMCPVGSWAPEGRSTESFQCSAGCASADYMGTDNCDGDKKRILREVYDALNGDYWNENNWFEGDDECSWTGITCSDDAAKNIVKIRLTGMKLTGTVPASIFTLEGLQYLDLSNNFINFKFYGIAEAVNLQVLDLSNIGLDSLVDFDQLARTQISELYMSNNNLHEKIPDALYDLTNLKWLKIGHNKLHGSISTRIKHLVNLKVLYLYGNNLSGELPEEFSGLRQTLQILNLSENDFTGKIPDAFSNMARLESIRISQKTKTGAGLTGEVPDFSNSPKLKSVHLASNSLSGYLPKTFMANSERVDKQITVNLNYNKIRGSIPNEWDMFGYLNIYLAHNLIEHMHHGLCSMKGWQDGAVGDIDGCDAILCGKGSFNAQGRATLGSHCIPCPGVNYYGATTCDDVGDDEVRTILETFYASTNGDEWSSGHGWLQTSNPCDGKWHGITCDNDNANIVGIDLADMGLSGRPDPIIFNLPLLESLDLSSNKIDFSFNNIGNARHLKTLRISNTRTSSLLGVGKAESLTKLHLTGNYMTGHIPEELYDLTNLRGLYMNYNQFTGRMSSKIGQLVNLEDLFILKNDLTGQIPASIGNLRRLKSLTLSENYFVGSIPESINNMKDLEVLAIQGTGSMIKNRQRRRLKVHHRRMQNALAGLTGSLPTFAGLGKLHGLYLGFNSLNGNIPFNLLAGIEDKTKPITVELESNYLTGVVPASLTQFDDLGLFISDNRFTGIAPGLCSMDKWLEGDVGSFNCDAILCPKNTFNEEWGRQSSTSTCSPCPTNTVAPYMGSVKCVSADQQAMENEKNVLKTIYDSLDGIGWHSADNWYDDSVSFCDWYGITCTSDAKSVQAINLGSNGLNGALPNAVFNLPNLLELNLGENDIAISFESIGRAANLKYLNLDGTGIKSLSGIENAPALTLLHASKNSLSSFPQEILKMSSLQVLYLSYNKFESAMPDLSGLTQLAFFACKRCGFIGKLPSWLGDSNTLQYLSLSGNKLTGAIPGNLATVDSLTHLDLSDQAPRGGGLTGAVPSFADLGHLSELYLHKNKLSGGIPQDFLAKTKATSIMVDLRKNLITGQVPQSLVGRFDNLVLLLAGNKIDGIADSICEATPAEWNQGDLVDYGCNGLLCKNGFYSRIGRETDGYTCKPCMDETDTDTATFYGSTTCGTSTEMLALEAIYNALGGPDWSINTGWMDNDEYWTWHGIECDSENRVIGIDLTDNNVVGEVPEEMYALESLTYLKLKGNTITIDFDGIEKLSSLTSLNLSETGLTSISGIGAASSLEDLNLTGNELTALPNELFNLVNLKILLLNYNKLRGKLSSKIGQLISLEELFMFRNELSGSLPNEIANLKNIRILALGENKFSGELPSGLNDLQSVEVLALQQAPSNDVSGSTNRGFSGQIPPFDNNPKLKELYLRYNSLSGSFPNSFLRGIESKTDEIVVDVAGNMITGSLPSTFNQFLKMKLYVAGNKISELDDSFCDYGGWMDGEVQTAGCDAIMCPIGFYNEFGRETNEANPCQPCPFTFTAPYFGSTSCTPDSKDYNEREILMKLYKSTGGSKWLDADNWLEDDISICDWHGIYCTALASQGGNSVVTEIHLPSNKMEGTVPPQVFDLQNLRMFNVRDNKVDVELFAMRESPAIEELYLDFTHVSSLKGIGRAKNLKTLHLQSNNLRGESIPEELFNLNGLKHLFLSDTNISGELSSNIGKLTQLEEFYCHGNDLSGEIPEAIGLLEKLEVLVLSENMFVGPLPDSISNLSSLQSLFIDSLTRRTAGLSGPLPSFEGLPNLRQIYLNENSLTGQIPENFLSNAHLLDNEHLSENALAALARRKQKINVGLKGNRLEGSIPNSLSTFEKLTIDLADNLITSIDDAFCKLDGWMGNDVSSFGCKAILCPAGTYNRYGRQTNEHAKCEECEGAEQSKFLGATKCMSEVKKREREILELFYNQCGGNKWKSNDNWLDDLVDICNWYGIRCSNGGSVESIDLGSNNVVGIPPSDIFELDNLKYLWLYSNPVKFSFEGIGQARHLESLLLDSTGLESLKGVGQAYQLKDLDLRFNNLKGSIPDELSNLVNLETLTLSNNKLTGKLPSFSRMYRLKSLRLSENDLTGLLPSFAANHKLKFVDLSQNRITGKISSSFLESVDTSSTIYVDLSRNRLEGKVPGELSRFDQMTIYLKDNYLFGIERDVCDNHQWNDGDVEHYGCDAILCPPGTYAPGKGRQSLGGSICKECKDAKFYGQSQCVDLQDYYSNAVGRAIGMTTVFVVTVVTMVMI